MRCTTLLTIQMYGHLKSSAVTSSTSSQVTNKDMLSQRSQPHQRHPNQHNRHLKQQKKVETHFYWKPANPVVHPLQSLVTDLTVKQLTAATEIKFRVYNKEALIATAAAS
jgi:hypothetical protein